MLGIAARSSIAIPIGPFRKFGAISVTNTAIPIAVGIAKIRASAVVTNVPKIVVAAPKTLVTGFQAVDVRKLISPNFPIASEDSLTSTNRIPIMKIMMLKDAMAVRKEKRKSMRFFLGTMAKDATFLLCRMIKIKRVRYQ